MFSLNPVGQIRSSIKSTHEAPRQGFEGAPDAWLDIDPAHTKALKGVAAGDELIIITWLHQANREVLEVHPRGEVSNPLTGVFATRSPARPNPLGLHRVSVREVSGTSLLIGPIEAIDGTPVLDIKRAFDDQGVA
jgi:tRNA-Thr(GGU) m(6)t(6)A37 methyltransferase TsaA